MYEKWIEDDTADLKVTKEQIKEIQDKIAAVKASQGTHETALAEKELILAGKEDVLSVRTLVCNLRHETRTDHMECALGFTYAATREEQSHQEHEEAAEADERHAARDGSGNAGRR